MNVFHQHLVNIHPVERQKTSLWLSNGFKVQSFKSKGSKVQRSQTYIKPNTADGYYRCKRSASSKLCRDFSVKTEIERQRELEMVLNDNLKQSTDLGEVTISPLQIGGLSGPNRLAADFNLQKG